MDRHIYSFRLREGEARSADPLEIDRLLSRALDGDLDGLLARAETHAGPDGRREPQPQLFARYQAEEKLAAAACVVFDLPAFDEATGQGTLESDALGVLYDYLAWCSVCRERQRENAELAHWFPSLAPALLEASGVKIDYHFRVGLQLNLPRIQAQMAAAVACGASVGTSNEDIDLALADAMARYPEEAWRILQNTNAPRMMARLRAGLK